MLGMVEHASNPSTLEVEPEGTQGTRAHREPQIQGQSRLYTIWDAALKKQKVTFLLLQKKNRYKVSLF